MTMAVIAFAAQAANINLSLDTSSAIRRGGNHRLSAFYQASALSVGVNMVGYCTGAISSLALTILTTGVCFFAAEKVSHLQPSNPWRSRLVKVLSMIDVAARYVPLVIATSLLCTGAFIPAAILVGSQGIHFVSTWTKMPLAMRNVATKVNFFVANLLTFVGTKINLVVGIFWLISQTGNFYYHRQVKILERKRQEAFGREGMSWSDIGAYYRRNPKGFEVGVDLFAMTHSPNFADPKDFNPEKIVEAFDAIDWNAKNYFTLMKALKESERWIEEGQTYSPWVYEHNLLELSTSQAMGFLSSKKSYTKSVEVKWARKNIVEVLQTIKAEAVSSGRMSDYTNLHADLAYIQKRLDATETASIDALIQLGSRLGLCSSGLRQVVVESLKTLCADDPNLSAKMQMMRAVEEVREKLWEVFFTAMQSHNLNQFSMSTEDDNRAWAVKLGEICKIFSRVLRWTGVDGDIHIANQSRALLQNIFGLRDTGQKDDVIAHLPYILRWGIRKVIAYLISRSQVSREVADPKVLNDALINFFFVAIKKKFEKGGVQAENIRQLFGDDYETYFDWGDFTYHGIPVYPIHQMGWRHGAKPQLTSTFMTALMLHLGFAHPRLSEQSTFAEYVNSAFI